MDSNEIKAAMKKAHEEMTALETQLADADEGKKAVVADMIEGKTKEWDTLKADLAHAMKREQIQKEMDEMEAKRNETKGTIAKIHDVEVDGKSDHNKARDEMQRNSAVLKYLTLPCDQGGAKRALYEIGQSSELERDLIPSTTDPESGKEGVKLPSYMAKYILNPLHGKSRQDIRDCIGGKGANDVVTTDAAGTNSGGGALVPDIFVDELYVIPQVVARLMDKCMVKRAVGGTAYFPTVAQNTNRFGVAVSIGTEGSSITEDNPSFHRQGIGTNQISGLSQISKKELRVNNVGLEAELAQMFRGAMAATIDNLILNGDASATQWVGINTNTAINTGFHNQTVALVARNTAAAVDYDDVIALQYAIEPGSMDDGMYVLKTGVNGAMKYIHGLKDTAGRPIFMNENWQGKPVRTIAGAEAVLCPESVNVGNRGDVVYGAFRNFGVALDEDVTIERSDHYAFNSALVTFRCMTYVGGKPLGYGSFAVLGDASGASSSSSSSSS